MRAVTLAKTCMQQPAGFAGKWHGRPPRQAAREAPLMYDGVGRDGRFPSIAIIDPSSTYGDMIGRGDMMDVYKHACMHHAMADLDRAVENLFSSSAQDRPNPPPLPLSLRREPVGSYLTWVLYSDTHSCA